MKNIGNILYILLPLLVLIIGFIFILLWLADFDHDTIFDFNGSVPGMRAGYQGPSKAAGPV